MANRQSGNSGMQYIDRGDLAIADFGTGSFTVDGAYHDLDLSSIIPAGTVLALASVLLKNSSAGKQITFRQKGFTNEVNISRRYSFLAAVAQGYDLWLRPDVNGIIEYKVQDSGIWNTISLSVRGWLV